MAGITSYGAYFPRYRLPRERIFDALGWYNPFLKALAAGEKAVANHDEDSLTMAVAAGLDCLAGGDPKAVGGLYLASTTLPYQERQNAAIAAQALDLSTRIRALDVTGAITAGTRALLDALDAVKAGSLQNALVCAADTRMAKVGSPLEYVYGDGAAAIGVGTEKVIAELLASESVSYDFVDHRRAAGERFDRMWEERWIRDEGLTKILPKAVMGLLQKAAIPPNEIAKLVIPLPAKRALGGFAKQMGLGPEAVQDNLMGGIGDVGAAYPLVLLAAALEQAKPGDKILVIGFGSGADAMIFQVTDAIAKLPARLGVKGHLAARAELDSYEKICAWRDVVPLETGIRGEVEAPTALSTMWRDRFAVFGLYGSRCKACGTPQFPPQRVCVNPECGVIDQMEPYRFAGRPARAFTYTADRLAVSLDPPAIYGLIDFAEGGRMWLDFTDCALDDLEVDMPMQMTFRRKYIDRTRAVHGYFWKAAPAGQEV